MYKHLVDPRRLEIRVSNPTGGLALPKRGGAQLSRQDGNENEVAKQPCIRSR
jgi:hypothetical protein